MITGPVRLEIAVPVADITIVRGRDAQVVVTAEGLIGSRSKVDGKLLASLVTVNQEGNYIRIGHNENASYQQGVGRPKITYKIEAPESTQISSSLQKGNLTVVGLQGPVRRLPAQGTLTYPTSQPMLTRKQTPETWKSRRLVGVYPR
ncbi:MAG TPA: hypothetical protein VEZ90_05915 [Blastocatellia bacterium]|nr:hypothetical protein [Blastocatellia bacterium]